MVFPSQIDRIVKTIDDRKTQLEQEQKQWFWMHKERKHNKIEDLEALKTKLTTTGLNKQSLADFRSAHPELDKGYFFQRTRDMLDEISKLLPSATSAAEKQPDFFAAHSFLEKPIVSECTQEETKPKAVAKNFISSFPKELVKCIGQNLDPLSLVKLSQTDKALESISNDNSLWFRHLSPSRQELFKASRKLSVSSISTEKESLGSDILFNNNTTLDAKFSSTVESSLAISSPLLKKSARSYNTTIQAKELYKNTIKLCKLLKTITKEQRYKLNKVEELIIKNKLTVEEALALKENEHLTLNEVKDLIINNILTINQAKNLNLYECSKLKYITNLILKNKITIKKALTLTFRFSESQCIFLNAIEDLIIQDKLTLEEGIAWALRPCDFFDAIFKIERNFAAIKKLILNNKLTEHQILSLTKYKDIYNLFCTQELILNDILTVEEAQALTKDESRNIRLIDYLIIYKIMTIKDALALKRAECHKLDKLRQLTLNGIITKEEALNLTQDETYILHRGTELILNKIITKDYALKLNKNQINNLRNTKNSILLNLITIEKAKNLKHRKSSYFDNIWCLILQKIITLKEARNLKDSERADLSYLKDLLLKKIITPKDVKNLTNNEYQNLSGLRDLILK